MITPDAVDLGRACARAAFPVLCLRLEDCPGRAALRDATVRQSTRTAPVGGSQERGFSTMPVEGFSAPTNLPSPT